MNTEREEMKRLLANWPVKGRVLKVTYAYDPETQGDVPMEIDEYGNSWINEECVTEPPKLPLSWPRMKERLEVIMRQAGLDPVILEKYERQYCTMTPKMEWEH